MSDNPFAPIQEGVQSGLQMGLMNRYRQIEQQKMQMQMQQMHEQQDMAVATQAIAALNSDMSGPTTKSNAKLILNNIFKKYAPQMGMDPNAIHINFDHENDATKDALDGIDANIKGMLQGKVHPDDFITNMKDHLQTLSMMGTPKSVTETAQKAGDSALALGTKTPETKDVEMGGQKTAIQWDPVNKKWDRVVVGGQPVTQPVPAQATDTGPLNNLSTLQSTLNDVATNYNPSFVGPMASRASGAEQMVGALSKEESAFRAKVAAHAQAAKQYLDANPGAAKDVAAIPDLSMPPQQFEAALASAKQMYRSHAQNHIATMIANGVNVSPQVAQAALNMPKPAPKPAAGKGGWTYVGPVNK